MPEANFLKVACSCGKSFKAPATAVGKRARCPACSAILTISAGPAARPAGAAVSAAFAPQRAPAVARQSPPVARRPSTAPPPVQADPVEDPMDALDELARQEESATPLADNTARCPHCSMPMSPGAVLCTNCGYDARTGKKLALPPAPKPAKMPAAGRRKANAVVDRMAPTGSFVAGLVFSLIFAMAASLLWIGLAYLTGFAIGYIAILIGGAAGVGMQLGHKGYSRVGGYAAAALTLVAIFLAKFAVLELILSRSHIHHSISDLDPAKLGYYFFSPIGLIIIVIGMAAAFRTANGSVTG